jgi:hypothetical protein
VTAPDQTEMDEDELRHRGMWNLADWHQIPCVDRDLMLHSDHTLKPFSSLTDLEGEYGEALIYTEWGTTDPDNAVLRDYRWPQTNRDCEHWVPDAGKEIR